MFISPKQNHIPRPVKIEVSVKQKKATLWWHHSLNKLQKYNLPDWQLAIIMLEHGGKLNNNVGNLRNSDLSYRNYPSLNDGVKAFEKVLNTKYKGMSLRQISKKYSERPDKWLEGVNYWQNLIKKWKNK